MGLRRKPLEGAIKVFNKDSLDAEKVITFTYFQGKFSYDNEEEAKTLAKVFIPGNEIE